MPCRAKDTRVQAEVQASCKGLRIHSPLRAQCDLPTRLHSAPPTVQVHCSSPGSSEVGQLLLILSVYGSCCSCVLPAAGLHSSLLVLL